MDASLSKEEELGLGRERDFKKYNIYYTKALA
jgi:hypothetical protein